MRMTGSARFGWTAGLKLGSFVSIKVIHYGGKSVRYGGIEMTKGNILETRLVAIKRTFCLLDQDSGALHLATRELSLEANR
jgi:hypothetical protein